MATYRELVGGGGGQRGRATYRDQGGGRPGPSFLPAASTGGGSVLRPMAEQPGERTGQGRQFQRSVPLTDTGGVGSRPPQQPQGAGLPLQATGGEGSIPQSRPMPFRPVQQATGGEGSRPPSPQGAIGGPLTGTMDMEALSHMSPQQIEAFVRATSGGQGGQGMMTGFMDGAAPGAPAGTPPPAEGGRPGIPIQQLGQVIEERLANPSRFDLPAVQQAYEFLSGDLEQTAAREGAAVRSDAARRGVFYGTPLTEGMADVRERFIRGKGDLATQLLLAQAQTQGSDAASAVNQASDFGQRAEDNSFRRAELNDRIAARGEGGDASVAQGIAALLGLPSGGEAGDNGIYALLGQLFAQRGENG